MSDELKATCEFCGCEFEPHSGSYWLSGITAAAPPQPGEGCEVKYLDAAEFDPATLKALETMQPGEHITTGAVPVCDRCAAFTAEGELGVGD